MPSPLTLATIAARARTLFGKRRVVWVDRSGRTDSSDWERVLGRAARTSGMLRGLGVERGDRVATLSWNSLEHLEVFFGIPLAGAVLHPLNLRLPVDQLASIVRHAGDKVVFVDSSLLPLWERIAKSLEDPPTAIAFGPAPLYGSSGGRPLEYEAMLAQAAETPPVDLCESDALGLCYTSGTTGAPKGVLYSHRSVYQHALAQTLVDTCRVSKEDTALQIPPLFHALGWGLPYAAALVGATLVLPGSNLQPPDLVRLLNDERVTYTGAVPTVWTGILRHLETHGGRLESLLRILVAGSAPQPALVRSLARFGAFEWLHAWGMTETSPLATVMKIDPAALGPYRQGSAVPGIEIRAVGRDQKPVPWDATTPGELEVRGPWVARGYFGASTPEAFDEEWLRTGDVVTIDAHGAILLVDRTKDLIKSGGEWISSVDLENALMAHPGVAEAAVIAVPHPHWGERPLACVVRRPGALPPADEVALAEHLETLFPKWMLPDAYRFLLEIPKTSVGKFDKKALRERSSEGL